MPYDHHDPDALAPGVDPGNPERDEAEAFDEVYGPGAWDIERADARLAVIDEAWAHGLVAVGDDSIPF